MNIDSSISDQVLKMMNCFHIDGRLFQVIRIEEEDMICFELIVQEPQDVMLLNNMKGVSLTNLEIRIPADNKDNLTTIFVLDERIFIEGIGKSIAGMKDVYFIKSDDLASGEFYFNSR